MTNHNFINSLKDGRNVWLNGKKVDITTDENFSGTLQTISQLYELFEDPKQQALVGYLSPQTNEWVHSAFLVPQSYEDVLKRRTAFEAWSKATDGIMSRLSDYARSRLAGWYANRERYRSFDAHFPDKISAYYETARDEHRFLSVVQRDPQVNRAEQASKDIKEAGLLAITKKTEDGVYVNGAKMIGTASPYSHDLIVYPLSKLEESRKALAHMLIVAANSPGLHMVCRESFATDPQNKTDHPLSSQYDEMDAVLIFDNVFVPWERVLLYDTPEGLAHIKADPVSNGLAYHQAIIRLLIKLEFVAAVANEIAEAIGANTYLHVQEKLGELIMQTDTIRALIIASEHEGKLINRNIFVPNFNFIQTARTLGAKYYPRSIEILQLIGAGGFIQLPSSMDDFNTPISGLLKNYFKGANIEAEKRTKLFKLAWDLIGSPLGSRHELYERFYAGDPMLNTAKQYNQYDKQEWKNSLDKYLKP
ncbi:4-hydroxyphenylacetate 3-hydroxylase family protein [Cytobacillus purgationiresistens]|uniref:4-hydroxyphenylacetate 3-monooxygenase n=1 Tax=Cytobacillus purgationiresistens TaxID=863449 RepID=A0ABU0AK38_9BACI|nr:4-hydroxyphenylacetate 3-hydroxylase N-terminal domain-containing protein [Cytobacillus purgationiresistens]MDQ0271628.1 4-hydroxyphenylacetate 3-monooxygenase [Cytobacillus purgationiresistens]